MGKDYPIIDVKNNTPYVPIYNSFEFLPQFDLLVLFKYGFEIFISRKHFK
jgi:hypothetical protein